MLKTFRGQATQDENGLWVTRKATEFAHDMRTQKARRGMFKRKDRKRTVYGPTGRPIAVVHVSGFGNTEHEFDNHQDAVARPHTVKVSMSEMRDRGIVGPDLTSKPLPPPGFYDIELARLRAKVETDPAAWTEYQDVKRQMVACLMERKRRRDTGV